MTQPLPDKNQYFAELHQFLGRKHNLSAEAVFFVREQIINQNKTRIQIIEEIADEIDKKDRAIKYFGKKDLDRNEKLKYDFAQLQLKYHALKHLWSWLIDCAEPEWEEVTQLTPFDKQQTTEPPIGGENEMV
jgi:hypothetical protein